ncbi:aldehyde dehydrogenase family protein [Azospirillum melinis]|uniref:Aldehyde dehydrogenase family protein n=1 Tax=Azospirillum melinis TaxID=328839 RepID=A0ABX2KEX6_9PROT|nr:aldehyde dehydrogenase family protein [Azospirillum melinis]MBP2308459.1 acyl-CoA reductase-like NAD-dependent aldehyde dehydrogenase [Azospirillum melinis]NUB01326.1 aldehyde dehydrogenase family protein [Azospirillum melinis]
MSDYKLLIGGRLVAGDTTMPVVNPATEAVIADCPRGSAAQMDEAVAAAKAAFPGWAALPIAERRAAILRLADALNRRAEEFARLLTREQGKPLAESTAELAYTEAFLRSLATLDLPVRVVEDGERRRVELHRRPLGVVAAIIPWNFPLLIVAFKLPLALLAGNTIIIKPAPTTPLTTLRFGELCAETLPPGVVNIVTDANDLGARLSSHPDVRKVTFTGSTETGRRVMSSAAATIKRITLELGGNDAAIVLDDADPKTVAPQLFAGAFMNAGQVCLAIKRLYVHERRYDAICAELAALAEAAVVGDGLLPDVRIGPLQNRAQYDKVLGFLEEAGRDGRIIAGGAVTGGPGWFIRPTIVRDIADGARLVDEEQFGPILPVIKVTGIDDAVRRANASPYGLGASVWSSNPDRAYEVACRLEAGTVWINTHLDFGPTIPFGGAKQSGLGVEFAEEGLAEFTQLTIINRAISRAN